MTWAVSGGERLKAALLISLLRTPKLRRRNLPLAVLTQLIVIWLEPGFYGAVVSGKADGASISLVEVFEFE